MEYDIAGITFLCDTFFFWWAVKWNDSPNFASVRGHGYIPCDYREWNSISEKDYHKIKQYFEAYQSFALESVNHSSCALRLWLSLGEEVVRMNGTSTCMPLLISWHIDWDIL